ncbi:MAG: S8 family peptidase [Saprospiraceae bacterium]|nr:S8 family peptidase [Saprospiraceae bacterium]
MKYLLFQISIFCFLLNGNAQVKLSQSLIHHIENHGRANAILLLKEKPVFAQYQSGWTKEKKTSYVYNVLISHARQTQRPLLDFLNLHQIPHNSFWIVNAIRCEINSDQLELLVKRKEISSIVLDQAIHLSFNLSSDLQSLQSRGPDLTWGLQRMAVEEVWKMGIDGKGVILAGHDTGYKWDMVGIKEKYRGWNGSDADHNYNWHDAIHEISPLSSDSINPCGLKLAEPCDDHGHGTHTAGTMVGYTDDLAYGVAPGAKWIGCRNMERGNGAPSTYIECFEFFLAPTDLNGMNPRTDLAPHAINNSWYCSLSEGCHPDNFHFMEEVIDHLTLAGVVVVVSAGNQGNNCGSIAFPPAIFKNSFTVGSFAENDTISSFSSIGPVYIDSSLRIKPDVVAPGSGVLSRPLSGNLEAWNGTSMAGPHVAGLVALIIQANPELSGQVEKIREIIQQSARMHDASVQCDGLDSTARPNQMYGYGKIMALEAVRRAIVLKLKKEDSTPKTSFLLPNPVKDILSVHSTKEGVYTVTITDLSGKVVYFSKENHSSHQINLQNLNQGVYLVNLSNEPIWHKLIKI